MKYVITGVLGVVLMSGVCRAGDKLELKSEKDKINYSVGYQIGNDFKRQGVELNSEALVQGIRDSLAKVKPLMLPEEMRTTLINLKKKIVTDQEEQRKLSAERHRAEGLAFLSENAKKEGVKTLANGVQYKVLREGSGRKPTLEDTVTVNYRGTLIDGTEFDSTYRDNKPRSFPLADVIVGWKETLPLMKEGDKWQIFVPANLAFGESGPLADRTVIYELELVSVQPAK